MDRGRPFHPDHHVAQSQLCGCAHGGRACDRVSRLRHADRCRDARRGGRARIPARAHHAGAAELAGRRRHHRHGGILFSDAVVRDAGRSQRPDAARHPGRDGDGLRRGRQAARSPCPARRRPGDGGHLLAVERDAGGNGHPGPYPGLRLRHRHEHAYLRDRVPSLEPQRRDGDRQDARHRPRPAVHVHRRHIAGGSTARRARARAARSGQWLPALHQFLHLPTLLVALLVGAVVLTAMQYLSFHRS